MKSKYSTAILLLVLFVSQLAPQVALATACTSSISNVTARPDVSTVEEFSRYQITFVTNATLTGGIDTIHIRFPSEYRFNHGIWSENYVDIKGQPSGGVNYSAGLLLAIVPRGVTIYAGETVIVNLHVGMMKNPDRPGEYSFYVNTSKETTPVASPTFSITEFVNQNGISRAHVENKPISNYHNEEITIRFTTNQYGQLIGGVDQIIIDFPNGFRIPQPVDEKTIKINGIQMHSLPPAVVGTRMILPLSPTMNFPEYHHVEIVIAASAGITLDRDIVDARLAISTTKNISAVESFPFSMQKTPDRIYQAGDNKSPGVIVSPNGAGVLAQWTFTFPSYSIILIEGEYAMGFTIVFPNGTVLPGSIAAQHITVNGQASSGVLVNPSRREVIFTTPIGFPLYTDITIHISASAGIQNPPAAVYIMDILPLRGTKTMTTKSFEIKTVSDPVETSPQTLVDKVVKVTLNDPVAVKDGFAVVLDVAPQLIDGFTMVPLRFVSEGLGAGVEYDNTQNTVTLTLGTRSVVLWPGSTLAKVDNVIVTLAKAPIIRNDRTMVPVRFVSECFGARVDYVSPIDPITITMTADALTKMPTVSEIQAAQVNAAAGSGSAGTGAGTGTGTGAGAQPPDANGGSGAGNTVIGRVITLRAGSNNANLRKGPGTTYDIVGLLLPSETATIIEVKDNWYHIEFSYGLQAWIREDLVQFK